MLFENNHSITTFYKRAGAIYSCPQPSTMQINVTRQCNLACKHCHVECSPARKEDMSIAVADECIRVFKQCGFKVLDITGGAPEMSNVYKYLVTNIRPFAEKIIVRTNLCIYLEEGYDIDFLANNDVEVFASLPFYERSKTDRVRGLGVYDSSIKVLQKLNSLGYGNNHTLNLVYNPAGAILPQSQSELEKVYRDKLLQEYNIVFSNLFCITNMPIGRFGQWLKNTGKYDFYMSKLEEAYNADTLQGLMCKDMISVDYDGTLYDCDFNLSMKLSMSGNFNIKDIDQGFNFERRITVGNHCYACTAGAGSS